MTRTAGAASIVGGLVMILATVAPWATSESSFSQSGLARGDGVLSGALGVALMILGAISIRGAARHWVRIAAIIISAGGMVMAVVEDAKVTAAIAPVSATVHLGIGIYLLAAGSVVALIAGWRSRVGAVGSPHRSPLT